MKNLKKNDRDVNANPKVKPGTEKEQQTPQSTQLKRSDYQKEKEDTSRKPGNAL